MDNNSLLHEFSARLQASSQRCTARLLTSRMRCRLLVPLLYAAKGIVDCYGLLHEL